MGSALAKGPRLESYRKRLGDFKKATETVLRRMGAAVKANDPVAASYYVQQYQDIRAAQGRFRQSAKTGWGDVATIIDGWECQGGIWRTSQHLSMKGSCDGSPRTGAGPCEA